jgi:hypothetical protein
MSLKKNRIFYVQNTKNIDLNEIKNYFKIKSTINSFYKNRIYHLHNPHHLGDSVFNFILFYNIKTYIEQYNIIIYYYAKKEYINQLSEFICSKNIFLLPLENKPEKSIEIWINNKFINYLHPIPVIYNKYYINFFNIVLKKLYINFRLKKFYYEDINLLDRFEKLDNKFKNIDILILNSQPLSSQYSYNKKEWDIYILNLNKRFKILTTTKVSGVLCTFDDKLTIKDIAALSTRTKVVIAINSGVVPGLLNYYTLTNVKHFYIFDDRCSYSYPNFENKKRITDITMEELKRYIN